MLSSRKCLGMVGRRGGGGVTAEIKKKRRKSIVVCINHAAVTENYGNMSWRMQFVHLQHGEFGELEDETRRIQ